MTVATIMVQWIVLHMQYLRSLVILNMVQASMGHYHDHDCC